MADKEAVVYIVDLGRSMADSHAGRDESDLDWSMRYVWDKISTTVAASRKTWTLGVVGLRTDKTSNKQAEDDDDGGYDHINVIRDIGPMSMTDLRDLRSKIRPNKSTAGDAISAIIVAEDMIDVYTKKLKYNRRIILVTDGRGAMDLDDIDEVALKLNESKIELVVIGVDFDDPDYGFKEEDKSPTKAANEKLLAKLVDKCDNGVFGTMAQAVEELSVPRIKPTRPYKAYDGPLTLGDPEKFGNAAMSIHIERWFKTKKAAPPPASSVVVKVEHGAGTSQSTTTLGGDEMEGVEMTGGGDGFGGVKQERTYKVNDPSAPGGKKDVEFESLAKGYEYGRTVVPISESEWNITKITTKKSFEIVGFIPFTSYEPYLNMAESGVIVAPKFNEKAELALSSLINALFEIESYAVARYVAKDEKAPEMVLLIPDPKREGDVECLYDIPLPFAEDVRNYQFPPLDKVLTVGGKVLTKHRLLPTDELNQAMSDYVDAMDLSTFARDDDGKPAEYAPIDETYNPVIHRINQATRQRAVHPDEPIEPIPPVLLKYSHPPKQLVEQSQPTIEALIKAANVKKVPQKVKGRKGRERVKPKSDIDISALLGGQRRETITPENAIPEFKQAFEAASDNSAIEDAVQQMAGIIRSLIRDSTGNFSYARAQENIGVMREELLNMEMPDLYNDFIRDLKKKLLGGELNGDRREMWWRISQKYANLGLITESELDQSGTGAKEAEALEFLTKR